MIVARTLVDPYFCRRVDRAHYDIQTTISIQIPNGRAPVVARYPSWS
jgi:hypothetical protein